MKVDITGPVAAALKAQSRTADEILREALGVKEDGLFTDGVFFPDGTHFLAWYKDRPYWGKVRAGQIEMNDELFPSVSAAASKITGRPTNGWDFWQSKLPGKHEFTRISRLREGG